MLRPTHGRGGGSVRVRSCFLIVSVSDMGLSGVQLGAFRLDRMLGVVLVMSEESDLWNKEPVLKVEMVSSALRARGVQGHDYVLVRSPVGQRLAVRRRCHARRVVGVCQAEEGLCRSGRGGAGRWGRVCFVLYANT